MNSTTHTHPPTYVHMNKKGAPTMERLLLLLKFSKFKVLEEENFLGLYK